MKKWFAKFRISTALDSEKKSSANLKDLASLPDDVREFAQNSAALDAALKQTPPSTQVPLSLHDSIMRSVRKSQPEPTRSSALSLRWIPASAFGLLVVLAIWWSLSSPKQVRPPMAENEPLSVATTTLELGQELSASMPAVVVDPVSQEWNRLNQDMTNTVNHLLASIPFDTFNQD